MSVLGDLVLRSGFFPKPSQSAGFLSPPFPGGTPNALIMHLVFRSESLASSRSGS